MSSYSTQWYDWQHDNMNDTGMIYVCYNSDTISRLETHNKFDQKGNPGFNYFTHILKYGTPLLIFAKWTGVPMRLRRQSWKISCVCGTGLGITILNQYYLMLLVIGNSDSSCWFLDHLFGYNSLVQVDDYKL